MRCTDKLRAAWVHATTYHQGGHYSIERLCEFSEYSQQATLWRVFGIFLLSVLPSLTTIVVLDAVPLQDPFAGWDKNHAMWIRVFAGTFVLSLGAMFQVRSLAPAAGLTLKQCISMSLVLSAVYQLTVMTIAALWVFPVPFMMLLGNPPWTLAMLVGNYVTIGRERLAANPEIKVQFRRFMDFGNVSGAFLVVFPVYSKIFQSLEGAEQTAFIFVLPVVKFVLKRFTRRAVADVEELVPVLVVTVDLFSALFQAKCMQNSGSVETTAAIILIDAVQNALSLRKLFRFLDEVQRILPPATGLLAHCEALLEVPERLELRELKLRSWTEARLSSERVAIVAKLSDLQHERAGVSVSRSKQVSSRRHSADSFSGVVSEETKLNSVVPWPPVQPTATIQSCRTATLSASAVIVPFSDTVAADLTAKDPLFDPRSEALRKSLALLWRCESVLLVEYIEAIVPLVFSISMSVLYYLPNARYYPGMAEMTEQRLQSAVVSILIYSLLEFLSLLYLHAALKWRIGVSALHQLAFVLEKQWLSMQGLFLSWVVIVLSFTLVHYGNDFTFKFEWVRHPSTASP